MSTYKNKFSRLLVAFLDDEDGDGEDVQMDRVVADSDVDTFVAPYAPEIFQGEDQDDENQDFLENACERKEVHHREQKIVLKKKQSKTNCQRKKIYRPA